MEDLSSYIILPLNGDTSFQLLPNLISGLNASINDGVNEKVFTNIEYLISHNPEVDNVVTENIFVNTVNPLPIEVDQPTGTSFIENIDQRNEVLFQCPKCASNFKECDEYLTHLKTHETEICLECTKCRKSFNKLSLYRKHQLIHQEEKLFNCPICQIGFNIENNYKVHMALHGNSLICPVCSLSFQRKASLKSHLAIHQVEEFHTCPECSSEFENVADLRKHMKTHSQHVGTQPKELICPYCKVKFDTSTLLRQHISSHVKVKKLVLNGKKFKKNQVMITNVENKHKCAICDKTFPKFSLLERHMRIHSGERPFVCRVCDKGFTQKGTLQIHMLKHSGLRPYCCTLCPSKFNQKGNLKVHVQKTHTAKSEGEKTFKCTQCDCIFKKVASLNGHMTKIHSSDTEEITITSVINQLKNLGEQLSGKSRKLTDSDIPSTVQNTQDEVLVRQHVGDTLVESFDEELSKVYSLKQKFVGTTKVYVCCYCDKESKKPSDLIRHMRTHTKEKPFKCHCGNSFSLKQTLLSHMQTHKRKNNKHCTSCSRVFSSSKAWSAHMRRHNSSLPEHSILKIHNSRNSAEVSSQSLLKKNLKAPEKSLKCQSCSASFSKKENLKRHIQLHSGQNKFKCKICLRSFSDASTLKEHTKVHVDLKYFGCEICNKKFDNKSFLMRHVLTHNTMKPYGCPYCKKKFKTMIMCRKHIDTHNKSDEQEGEIASGSNVIYTEQNDAIEQDSTNTDLPTAILKIDSTGVILDQIYDINQEKVAVNDSLHSTSARLELDQNQDLETIFVNCSDIPADQGLGNYFFSQLRLEPNNTIVLNSVNGDLEQTPLLFNMQPMDTESLPMIDIVDGQLYDCNSPEKIMQQTSSISPQMKSPTKKLDKVIPITEEENCTPNDISDNFLANNVSLYPNTQVSFENSEISSVPLNLLPPQENDLGSAENENNADINLFDINLRQAQPEDSTALSIIHCLLCRKMFDNMDLYQSHVCAKSRKNSSFETIHESIQMENSPATTSHSAKTPKAQEKAKRPVKTQFHCVYCRKEFSTRGTYLRHVSTHQKNGSRFHNCKFCDKQFKKPSDLSRHLRTHTGEKPFACDKCDKKFSLKSTLEGHYRTHNPQATKDFVCEICNAFFSSNSSRKLHMLIHSGDKPHKCTFCDQRFRTVAQKRGHEKKMHVNRKKIGHQSKAKKITDILATAADMAVKNLDGNNKLSEQREDSGLTQIQLEFPDQTDPAIKLTQSIQIDQSLLQQLQNSNLLLQDFDSEVFHLRGNTFENLEKIDEYDNMSEDADMDDRDLECEVCHKKYASKEVLRKHMKLHLKNKFVCGQCKKWFPTIEALVDHEKVHTGYRPFSCFLCTNSFAELQHLKSHLRRIHQIVETNSPSILKMSLGETLHT